MRINSIPPNELLNKYLHVKKATVVKRPAAVDKAEITSEAKTFSSALKAAKKTMATRSPEELKHLETVSQQVKDNTYSVPGYKVAEKILGK